MRAGAEANGCCKTLYGSSLFQREWWFSKDTGERWEEGGAVRWVQLYEQEMPRSACSLLLVGRDCFRCFVVGRTNERF